MFKGEWKNECTYNQKEKTCIIKKNIRIFGFTCASLRILRNHGYRSNVL